VSLDLVLESSEDLVCILLPLVVIDMVALGSRVVDFLLAVEGVGNNRLCEMMTIAMQMNSKDVTVKGDKKLAGCCCFQSKGLDVAWRRM